MIQIKDEFVKKIIEQFRADSMKNIDEGFIKRAEVLDSFADIIELIAQRYEQKEN